MFRVSQHPSSGVLKTVSATSGISHSTGTTTSFHRGLINFLSFLKTFIKNKNFEFMDYMSPDQATVEGSSGTSTMTYTRGSRYSF